MKVRIFYDVYREVYLPQFREFGMWHDFDTWTYGFCTLRREEDAKKCMKKIQEDISKKKAAERANKICWKGEI